jgi:hypothetical protein
MPKPKPIKYVRELKQYYKMRGGGTFNSSDFDSIMKYVLEKLSNKIKIKTASASGSAKEKHLIMLYGPPASGKSIAKQIMLSKLSIAPDDYIDINLDDIIGEDETYQTTIETLKKEHNNSSDTPSSSIKKKATDIYFEIRNKANLVFELLVFITRLYDISLVVEVTGGTLCSMVWWDNIISFFQSKNYTISLIYPVVSDVNTIVSRADKRGNEIFRFVPPEAIQESIEGAKKNIKRILGLPFNRFNNIYIYYNDDARFHSLASSKSNEEGLLKLFKEKTIYMKENDKIIKRGSETSFMIQQIGKDIAFYKSNGERINSNSCKITY